MYAPCASRLERHQLLPAAYLLSTCFLPPAWPQYQLVSQQRWPGPNGPQPALHQHSKQLFNSREATAGQKEVGSVLESLNEDVRNQVIDSQEAQGRLLCCLFRARCGGGELELEGGSGHAHVQVHHLACHTTLITCRRHSLLMESRCGSMQRWLGSVGATPAI